LRVSKSKPIAASVFIIDLLKGWISVLIVASIYPGDYIFPMITLIAAVLAHCYSPWINFKGGRGLATAAGGGLFLSPIILVLWILLWLISYLVKNNSHIANFAASLFAPIISFVAGDFFNGYSAIHAINNFQFGTSLSILFIIILTKHIQPLRSLM
ncbi:MAG: glycerol-3-phosphate acyltransferase, partial [Bacteroidota bacterium]